MQKINGWELLQLNEATLNIGIKNKNHTQFILHEIEELRQTQVKSWSTLWICVIIIIIIVETYISIFECLIH